MCYFYLIVKLLLELDVYTLVGVCYYDLEGLWGKKKKKLLLRLLFFWTAIPLCYGILSGRGWGVVLLADKPPLRHNIDTIIPPTY